MQDWQWIQLNVGLVRQQQQALSSARQLFEGMAPFVHQWRETRQLQYFFFMRKPPDVRLRFYVNAPESVRSQLTHLTNELHQQTIINQSFFSEYEPECDRFGGSLAMEFVHAYFDEDTTQWLRLDQLQQQSSQQLPSTLLLKAILENLLESTLVDFNDVLSTWQKLGENFGIKTRFLDNDLKESILNFQSLQQTVENNTEMGQILHQYLNINTVFSKKLQSLYSQGQVQGNLPNILANVGQFTLHRHGFDWQSVRPLVGSAIAHLKLRSSVIHPLL